MKRCIVLMILLGGCAGSNMVDRGEGGLPQPFTLELRALSAESRAVYYVLESDGMLRYGAGSDARHRIASIEAGLLSDAEREKLWQIVERYRLLESEGRFFPESENVKYEVKLRAGPRKNSFDCADEDVAGLAELERALFALQRQKRFK